VRILLDTHSFLWFVHGDSRLSAAARNLIENPDNEVFVSVVSAWEISIKFGLGKLHLSSTPDIFFVEAVKKARLELLDVSLEQALAVYKLPNIHRDPFDRLLVVQCQSQDLSLISYDAVFAAYHLTCLN